MKRFYILSGLVVMLSLLQACSYFGKEKTFNGVELFHTQSVTDAEADRLGNYLVSSKFADGSEKAVQITKKGSTYQFRFVVKEGFEKDSAILKSTALIAAALSNDVFNGAPVEIDMCDKYMKTIKAFPYVDFGKKKLFDGVELYYTHGVKESEADSLGNYLIKSEFADGNRKTVQVNKTGGTYQFRFVVMKGVEKDPNSQRNAQKFAAEMSAKVFGGAPVDIQLCDEYMSTLATLPMEGSPAK